MAKPKLSQVEAESVCNVFAREAIKEISAAQLVAIFEGDKLPTEVFHTDFTLACIEEIKREVFDALFKPLLAEKLQRELGAKRVIIDW